MKLKLINIIFMNLGGKAIGTFIPCCLCKNFKKRIDSCIASGVAMPIPDYGIHNYLSPDYDDACNKFKYGPNKLVKLL